jgi:hypothetical protein
MSDPNTQNAYQPMPKAYDAVTDEGSSTLPEDEPFESTEVAKADYGNIAYELLLLQQRLAAYEQLHIEEMAELRQEIERLRRTFLQETNPQLRAISPRHLRTPQQ